MRIFINPRLVPADSRVAAADWSCPGLALGPVPGSSAQIMGDARRPDGLEDDSDDVPRSPDDFPQKVKAVMATLESGGGGFSLAGARLPCSPHHPRPLPWGL